jgi:hypothetical protein
MTSTVDVAFRIDPLEVGGSDIAGECIASEDMELRSAAPAKGCGARFSYNAKSCEALLDEPAIAQWAVETAVRYGVTTVDALELLAYALFLDGEK